MSSRPLALAFALSLLAACGSKASPTPAADSGGGPPGSPGSGSLTGSQGFPVAWAWMNPQEPSDECGATVVSSGGIAATAIELFENDESSLACSDAGLGGTGGTGRFIDLEIATTEYASQSSTLTQSLQPGTYVIGNEGENDEDLCMLPSGSTAILQVLDFGAEDAQEIGISGTVTITAIDAHSITGSFDAILGGPYGQTDGGPPDALSGTFSAVTCP